MDVPVELRPSYKKYLLYAHTMHPALRQQLLNDGKVMAELRYQNTDIDVSQMFAHSDISARLGTETLPALPAGYTVVPAAGVDGIPDAPAADEAAAPQNFPEYF